jgi:hypothetical protein
VWLFIFYLIGAGVVSWIFSLLAGLLEMGYMFLMFGKDFKVEETLLKKPKRFAVSFNIKNYIFGTAYSLTIITFTHGYLEANPELNYWLYAGLSITWSLGIVLKHLVFPLQFLVYSTLNVIAYWIGIYIFFPFFVNIIVLVVSLAYYLGSANRVQEESEYL